eukprot:CAMPEP_0204828572 /NCGR_PEP_ID=MMETSP1346-20131115/6418_1 /ASSEMBLY_ACC=CAM_ASM_000771 /TAXON_ID=215587 /ORGANISM="Aplanochytrium stocchinoi, Strain GSBS06" /LENGTH=104 /DNA_ID=CAMNT_0051957757 /DNA_START=142 /DNA_END=453 /DNA_ORIENTATION=-
MIYAFLFYTRALEEFTESDDLKLQANSENEATLDAAHEKNVVEVIVNDETVSSSQLQGDKNDEQKVSISTVFFYMTYSTFLSGVWTSNVAYWVPFRFDFPDDHW